MEIKIQIKDRVFSICIGHKTKWFEQCPFISVIEEFYENKQVIWANVIWQTRFIIDGVIY